MESRFDVSKKALLVNMCIILGYRLLFYVGHQSQKPHTKRVALPAAKTKTRKGRKLQRQTTNRNVFLMTQGQGKVTHPCGPKKHSKVRVLKRDKEQTHSTPTRGDTQGQHVSEMRELPEEETRTWRHCGEGTGPHQTGWVPVW